MNALLIPLIGIPILILIVGLLVWLSIKKEDGKTAVRLKKLHEKRERIALHGAQLEDDIVDDVSLHDLQGCWQMVSVGRKGNFAPQEILQKTIVKFEIKGTAFTIIPPNKTGTLKVDQSFSPVRLDQYDDGGDTHLCIVRVRNGELEICQSETGDERPENFNPNRHDNASLTRFKRLN